MISIIITAFESPDITKEGIKIILNQEEFHEDFELIVACPDEQTKKMVMDYKKKSPKIIKYIHQDYDCSKNRLMNKIIGQAKGRILIWTDGNKLFAKDTIKYLVKPFEDKEVGVVGGRIIPLNCGDTFFGAWARTLTQGLHYMRENRFKSNSFVEHTSNVLAMRSNILKKIPLDVAEGSVISFLIFNKGYKSVYAKKAKVYVKYPEGICSCFKQRARSAKAHMELYEYVKKSKIKYKNFYNAVLFFSIKYTFKEFARSLLFLLFLSFVQLRAIFSLRIRQKRYRSIWHDSSVSRSKGINY